MIQKIQLRGISRTPSDRMNSDGGCAESLNVILDQDEIAPAPIPLDLQDEYYFMGNKVPVFIHKTPSYENIISYTNNTLYFPNKDGHFMTLELTGESLKSVSSIGNTVVVSTDKDIYYVLYRNGEYNNLGTTIPEPKIEVQTISIEGSSHPLETLNIFPELGNSPIFKFDATAWEKDLALPEPSSDMQTLLNFIWDKVSYWKATDDSNKKFFVPFFIRYAIRLYDGTYINQSVPIYVGAGHDSFIKRISGKVLVTLNKTKISIQLQDYFTAKAFLKDWDISGWSDVISSIDIFASTEIMAPSIGEKFGYFRISSGDVTRDVDLKFYNRGYDSHDKVMEEEILSKANFFKIKSFNVSDLTALKDGYNLSDNKFLFDQDLLVTQEKLDDRLQSNKIIPLKTDTFNNKIIALGGKAILPSGYQFVPSTAVDEFRGDDDVKRYFAFYTTDVYNENHKVLGRSIKDSFQFDTYGYTYCDEGGCAFAYANMYGLIMHPDPNCTRVEILEDKDVYIDGQYVRKALLYSVPMHKHPFLNCSYAYWGIADTIPEQYYVGESSVNNFTSNENRVISYDNKLFFTDINNPFLFPLKNTITFDAKVLGIAISTRELSQGQFGQFPIYTFTGDGIWALETNAFGDVTKSTPMSREVCSNADSITPIDDAVVFATSKGLMLINGSTITNISPNMNGKHYKLDSTSYRLIKETQWCELPDVVNDSDAPFISYLNNASIAYDYEGNRLIVFKVGESYQYTLCLKTNTWHKTRYGKILCKLNSYPECLVSYLKEPGSLIYFQINDYDKQYSVQQVAAFLSQYFPNESDSVIIEAIDGSNVLRGLDWDDIKVQEFIKEANQKFKMVLVHDSKVYIFSNYDNSSAHITEEEQLEILDTYFPYSGHQIERFVQSGGILVEITNDDYVEEFLGELDGFRLHADYYIEDKNTSIQDLSTSLDVNNVIQPTKGIIVTRPFILDKPDILKTIKNIRVRGQFNRSAVQFILQGSNDGKNFYVISTLRGKSWKMFRLIILTNLLQTERISWIDVEYDTKLTNRLR